MTYVPVEHSTSRAGRKPLPIPDALLRQLEHTYTAKTRAEIEITPDTDPAAVNELRRALTRAGYRHYRNRTIHKRITDTKITFWMTDKMPPRRRKRK